MRPFGRIVRLFCRPEIASEVSATVLRISSESASSDTERASHMASPSALLPQDRPRPCRALFVAQAGAEDGACALTGAVAVPDPD
jgi:hypothetical protein